MATTLKLERQTTALDELLQETERLRLREKAVRVLKGRTPTEYIRDMRKEMSRKYTPDELYDYYTQP